MVAFSRENRVLEENSITWLKSSCKKVMLSLLHSLSLYILVLTRIVPKIQVIIQLRDTHHESYEYRVHIHINVHLTLNLATTPVFKKVWKSISGLLCSIEVSIMS